MPELKLYVPTYNHGEFRINEPPDDLPDFGEPEVPVVIRDADGIRIVLGTHDYWDTKFPDVQIERRPGGWAIFLHPLAGSDASGYVYFLDDGRSFICPERWCGPTEPIRALDSNGVIRRLDEPNCDPLDLGPRSCDICGNTFMEPADPEEWPNVCTECGDFVSKYVGLHRLPATQTDAAIRYLKLPPELSPPLSPTSITRSRRAMRGL